MAKTPSLPPSGMAAARGQGKRPANTSTKSKYKTGQQNGKFVAPKSDAAKLLKPKKKTTVPKGANPRKDITKTPGWMGGRGTI